MKKIKLALSALFLFCVFSLSLFAESTDLASLLFGYIKNDLTLQKYTLTAQTKALDYDSAKIENGLSFELSTGTVKIQSSADGTKYTFTPSLSVDIPELSDTTVSVSLPVTKKSGYSDCLVTIPTSDKCNCL